MKRIVTGSILIMLYVFLGVSFINVWKTDGKLMSNSITVDGKQNVFFMEQGLADIWIAQLNKDGKVLELFSCPKAAREVQSRCNYSNGTINVLQIWFQKGTQYFTVYQYDDEHEKFRKIWEQELAEDLNITDFYLDANSIRVSGVEQKTEQIVCYSFANEEAKKNIYKIESLPVAAYWEKDGMYVATSDNKVVYFTVERMAEKEILQDVIYFRPSARGMLYQKIGEDTLIYQQNDGLVTYTYPMIYDIAGMDFDEETATLTIMSISDKGLMFSFFTDEQTRKEVEILSHDRMLMFKNILPACVIYTLLFFVAVILCALFYHWVMSKKRLILQTAGVLVILSVIWISVMGICVYQMQQTQILKDRQFYARTCVMMQKENLMERVSRQELTYQYFENEGIRKIVEEILADSTLKDTWQELYARTEMLYGTETVQVAFSEELSYGTAAKSIYSNEIVNHISTCIETNTEQEFVARYRGLRYVFHIVPLGNIEDRLCLMIRIPFYGVQNRDNQFLPLIVGVVIVWVLVIIVLLTFLQTRWQSITMLISQMDKISKGDYRMKAKKIPENEIGEVWTSMERMCKFLQMQSYKNGGVLDYVLQFVPHNFEKLFGKENLQDIEVGEMIQLPATIGVISVMDEETLLTGKIQKQYIQYVNQLMEILFQQEGAQDAVFLQSGSNLENVKVVFAGNQENVDTCFRYNIGCLESLLEQPEKRYECNPFIILHTATYLCGLAGGSKQAYPFVISMELEMLNTYSNSFRKSGVKLVVTKQTKQQMHTQVQMRYIGYVASANETERFDLYEVLDCYSANVKAVKVSYLEKFQTALQLFYQNEYYLARSAFSEIMKACPEDGIARWYVFACEELLNKEEHQNDRHDLFYAYDK